MAVPIEVEAIVSGTVLVITARLIEREVTGGGSLLEVKQSRIVIGFLVTSCATTYINLR